MAKVRKKRGSNVRGKTTRVIPPEQLVLRVYRDIDREIHDELDRLRDEEGIEPTCREGCCHCCGVAILATLPEALVISNYIKQEFTSGKTEALRRRMERWFVSMNEDLPMVLRAGIDEHTAVHEFGPTCPLLDDEVCSVYPVRPWICRCHFATSNPRSCMPLINPETLDEKPVFIRSIEPRVQPHILQIREYIEDLDLKFSESVSLLPRWLAVELGWTDLLHSQGGCVPE